MWYFSWILGLGLACAFAVLNAMWYEVNASDKAHQQKESPPPNEGR
jgi:cyd operon protein YbgT